MKKIPLSRGLFALVDDEDYDELIKYSWCAMCPRKNMFYAARSIHVQGTCNVTLHPTMHRILMNPPKGKEIDHINGNGLDNRRENLRIVTRRQNSQNRHDARTSKYPGVSWETRVKKWAVRLRWNGKNQFLGHYKNEIEAATVYRVACAVLIDGK